jgi:hypothetical protein
MFGGGVGIIAGWPKTGAAIGALLGMILIPLLILLTWRE